MTLAAAPSAAERLWTAIGAAMALKAAHETAKKSKPKPDDETPSQPQMGVVLAYVRPGELTRAEWQQVLTFVAQQVLPLIVVLLPGSPKPAETTAIALKSGVPGIAVDAADAVALYRVAQESIVRARMGGGAALMECVPFVVEGGKVKPADAIATIEQYLLHRKVATETWMTREAKQFAKRLAAAKAAPK
jgi:TPP-dependent pyruvate/acetoin dehydrogenase alpha subunit